MAPSAATQPRYATDAPRTYRKPLTNEFAKAGSRAQFFWQIAGVNSMEGDFHEGVLMRLFLSLALVAASLGRTASAAAERVVLVAGGGTGGEGSPPVEAQLLSPLCVGHGAQALLLVVGINRPPPGLHPPG